MTLSGIFEFVAFSIGILIILYAFIAFVYRLLKGKPFWPNLKRAIKLALEGFWGIG